MSSEIFMFDSSFFSNPFSPFSDSTIEALQSISLPQIYNNQIQHNPFEETNCFDQLTSTHLSSSPQSHQFEDFPNLTTQFSVKTEELNDHHYRYQRSSSSNSFDGKVNFMFQSQIDPELRRVCSAGDLQVQMNHGLSSSSPLSAESSFMDTASFKVGRYSEEVRREKIHRYRVKRNQRNFNKTIKYACRKTLADNRPRVRGRFARNDEIGDVTKTTGFDQCPDSQDYRVGDRLNEDDDQRLAFNDSGPNQFHYYGGY